MKPFITPDVKRPEIQHYKTYDESLRDHVIRHKRCCGFRLNATIGNGIDNKKMFYFTGDIRKLCVRQKEAILSTKWNQKLTEEYVSAPNTKGLNLN